MTVPGRFEVMGRAPLIVVDGAHNPDGAEVAAETLDEDFAVPGRRILVVGLLAGRDIEAMLDALGAAQTDLIIACRPDSPRAVPADEVAAVAAKMDVDSDAVDDVGHAIDAALAAATARTPSSWPGRSTSPARRAPICSPCPAEPEPAWAALASGRGESPVRWRVGPNVPAPADFGALSGR